MKSLACLLLVLTLLVGCKGPDVARGFAKGNIHTVSIERVTPAPGLRLGLQTYGGTAGIADAIVNKMYEGDLQAIQASMDSINLNIAELVRTEFITQLKQRDLVQIVDQNPDAIFLIKITQNGINEYPPFTGNDLPFLNIVCRLVDKQEQTLWKSEALQTKRAYPGMGGNLKDYRNAEKLRKDWNAQVKAVVAQVLAPKESDSRPVTPTKAH